MRTATVFNYLVEATLIGSAVMVGVMLVRLLLRRHLGSRFTRALWLLVALRLLLPIALPNPLMNALRPALSADAGIRPIADQVRARVGDAATALYSKTVAGNNSPSLRQLLGQLSRAAGNGKLSWLLLLVYLSGGIGMAGGMAADNIRFRRKLSPQQPSEEMQALWDKICASHGLQHPPRLMASPALPSACAMGCFRPYVVAPQGVSEASLRHACAHIRLHTGFWGFIRDLCLCVHWFNPLVWVCAHLSRIDDALACDEWAVSSLEPQQRENYASWLIHQQDTPLATPAVWMLASCATMRAPALALRIRQALHPQPIQPAAFGTVCLAAALTLSVMFATDEQSSLANIPLLTSPPLVRSETDLSTSEAAEAYARRFLLLEGVYADTPTEYALSTQTCDGWHVSLLMPSGETCEVSFDQQGTLMYYNDTSLSVSSLRLTAEPSTAETEESRAWCEFLSDFLSRHAPEIYREFETMNVAASSHAGSEEYMTIHLLDADGRLCCVVDIQTAPEGRIYRLQRVKNADES